MGEFTDLTLSRVPEGFDVPEPIRLLFEWVEDAGLVTRGADGDLYGSLAAWPDGPGTRLLLRGAPPEEVEQLDLWFGPLRDGMPTIWPFCRTGGDGSQAALWRAPDGRTLVVHLGSGSGSILGCVLGDDAVDFLRLLAIGYDEICWNDDWHLPPQADQRPPWASREVVNEPFRRWVETTFGTTIPATAVEIVPAPAEFGDDSDDVWCRWLNDATSIDPVVVSTPPPDDSPSGMDPLFDLP